MNELFPEVAKAADTQQTAAMDPFAGLPLKVPRLQSTSTSTTIPTLSDLFLSATSPSTFRLLTLFGKELVFAQFRIG